MINSLRRCLVLATTLIAFGCASPGPAMDIPYHLPAVTTAVGKVIPATEGIIHTHNNKWPAWMTATDKMAIDYITTGSSAKNAPKAVAEAERACRIYTTTVSPNPLVAVLMNGAVYAASEFPFAMLGASAFKGAKLLQYGQYGASASAGGGVGNGIIQLGGRNFTFQNCARGIFEAAPQFRLVILTPNPY